MSEKQNYTISIFTENHVGLLHRITIIFTRRHINIESITASESEVKDIYRYTVVVKEEEEKVQKVVKQIEKLVEVLQVFFHQDDETVFQEIALYKMPIKALHDGIQMERIVRDNFARILTVEKEFFIIEKTGHKQETQDLFEKLAPYGLLEFVRSGRVSVTKPMQVLSEYLKELEQKHAQIEEC